LWSATSVLVAGCGSEATVPAAAEGLDCEATRTLTQGESHVTGDGLFRVTVHEIVTGRSAADDAGAEQAMVDAEVEVCRLADSGELRFSSYDVALCLVGPAVFGDERVNGPSYSNTGMESRSPELAAYPAFESSECERGWLGFPMTWLGPSEGVEAVGVYYTPNYRDEPSSEITLWRMP
jgi:hypothetical protein